MDSYVKILIIQRSGENCDDVHSVLDTLTLPVRTVCVSEFHILCEKLDFEHWDIIISGYNLDGYDVFDVLDFLKSQSVNIPLITVTDRNEEQDPIRVLSMGASDYILRSDLQRLVPSIQRELAQKENLKNLKRQEDEKMRLLEILDANKDELYIFDADTYRFVFVNSTALSTSGYNSQEIQSLTPVDLVPLLTFEKLESLLEPLLDYSKEKIVYNTELVKYDGTMYPAEISIQLIEKHTNRVFFATVTDITQRVEYHNKINMLTLAVDQSHSSIIITDLGLSVQYSNDSVSNLTGLSKQKIMNMNLADILHSDEKNFTDIVKQALEGEHWTGELFCTTHNDGRKPVFTSISPIKSMNNEIYSIVVVFDDISAMKEMEAQLLHAQKMEAVGELTGGIAHDFSNILTAIGGFTKIIQRKIHDDTLEGHIQKVLDLTTRAKLLTQNLLSFCRKQSGIRKNNSLSKVLSTVENFISVILSETIDVSFFIPNGKFLIYSDEIQLEQVFINLVTNARDAMQEGGSLKISLSTEHISGNDLGIEEGDYCIVCVSDTGSGIEEDLRQKIFEPFFTTKEEGKGTGLGLPIVKNIIQSHGGAIRCESTVGEGTSFYVYLPLAEGVEEAEADELDDTAFKGAHGILIVDDDELVRMSLKSVLEMYEYTTFIAENGRSAIDIFTDNKDNIDLLITDFIMPDMNGVTVYEELSAMKPELQVLYITGYTLDQVDKARVGLNPDRILFKPISINEMLKTLSTLL